MDKAIFITACVANICVLVAVWIRSYPVVRYIQTISFAFAVIQILQYYGFLNFSWRWLAFDMLNIFVELSMMCVLLYSEVNLPLGIYYALIIGLTCYEYQLADERVLDVANSIYHVRVIMDIIATFSVAFLVYKRQLIRVDHHPEAHH